MRRSSLPELSPEARKKQRISGGLLIVAVCCNLAATLLPFGAPFRTPSLVLFTVGTALLAASIVYMLRARRAS